VSDDLFHTNLDGEPAMLVDVMDDGLDGELDDRIPALRRLLAEGDAEERLSAARLLVAWADPAGIEALLHWAAHEDESPGAAVNRFTGGDATFARLADALRTSQYSVRAAEHEALRIAAGRALLELVEAHDFERELGAAVNPVRGPLAPDIRRAAERAIEALDDQPGFDLGTQAANLLMPLAREDDAGAAALAERLIDAAPKDSRMLREIVDGMAAGAGAATLAVLRRLTDDARDPAVRADADAALKRRS
jgi:hypothetical protein